MKCLDCAKFSVNDAKPYMQREWKGACKIRDPATALDAMQERDCGRFAPCSAEVGQARKRWIAGVNHGA